MGSKIVRILDKKKSESTQQVICSSCQVVRKKRKGNDHGGEGHHDYDPYVWLSPRAIKLVEHIRDSLSADYPDKKETFEKLNAAAYMYQALDKRLQRLVLAEAKRVSCDPARSLPILGFGLKQVIHLRLSPDAEPSVPVLVELTEYIKKNKISYIYFEENALKLLANTLSKETGVKLCA